MGQHLEITVLAVGQGSCSLVKEYDEGDQLIYLALMDCGRENTDRTMEEEIQQVQMEIIRSQMRERAKTANIQYGEAVADLYLDHLVVSHRDVDHLLFLSEEYLFKDLVASPMAMQKTDFEKYEKIRLRYKGKKKEAHRLVNGKFVLEMEDLDVPHLYRWEFKDLEDIMNSGTAAEYEYREQGTMEGDGELLGAQLHYEGEFLFNRELTYGEGETDAFIIDNSVMELTSHGESQLDNHEAILRIEFEHSTKGEEQTWIWNIELHDNRWAKEAVYHTDILYDIKVSLTLLGGEYVVGIEACIQYAYAGYEEMTEGGFWCNYNESDGIPEVMTILEVMELVGNELFENISTTPHCPNFLRDCYIEWTKEGFEYLLEVIQFCLDSESMMIGNAFEINSWEEIRDYILQNLPKKGRQDGPDTLLIGNIYVGGNKPGQTSNLAKNAILSTLQYSMNFYDEVLPKADMQITASITNKDGQQLDKWYLSDLYMLRMPAQYYYDEEGIPKTKDSYEEYAAEKKRTKRNAIRKANENDCSIFCVLHYPAVDEEEPYNFLIPGDATHNTMHHIIAVWNHVKSELRDCRSMMVAPHHGSFVTCKDSYKGDASKGVLTVFVSMLNTDSMIISAGYPSHFCHPHNSFIRQVCAQLHCFAETSDGLYYNTTDKGRGAKVSDYAMGMTKRYLVSTVYYEYDGSTEKFHYANPTAIGSANIPNISYVKELEDTVQHRNDLDQLY